MKKTVLGLLALIVSQACLPTTQLWAKLPPGMYTSLKKEATEVLILQVTKVIKTDKSNHGIDDYQCEARVVSVDRSMQGIKQGQIIRFSSYHVTSQARRSGFVGPTSPPLLRPGWYGRIYLNKGRKENLLEPAAYGQSFQKLRRRK